MKRLGYRLTTLTAALAFASITSASVASASPCNVTFGSDFAGNYSCTNLGAPDSVPTTPGGMAFLDNNTLLVGGSANNEYGVIDRIGVSRDGTGHIVGFSGPATAFASAPYIDGGLSFGPGGVLFHTGYPVNTISQIKAGSTAPDKVTSLSTLTPAVGSSVGAVAFVPAGFNGAGQLKIVSYSQGVWYSASLSPDGNGTYDLTVSDTSVTLDTGPGGLVHPEGMVYVDGLSAGFGGQDSVLINEYSNSVIAAYQIDANGDPMVGTRHVFLSGHSGPVGSVIDPVTGDFLFSSYSDGYQVMVVSGFSLSATPTPEPMSLAILGIAMLGLASVRRRS